MNYLALCLAVLIASGCAQRAPISVTPIINCPQPAAVALSRRDELPQIASLPGDDPSAVIGILSEVIVSDARLYDNESAKREMLIAHGVQLCGWVR